MTNSDFELWLQGFSEDQIHALRKLRRLITTHTIELEESVNQGKWLTGYIFYSLGDRMIYAIGPKGKEKTTFHMMPFYGSEVLRARHGDALAPFLTGKSCIAFRKFSELPEKDLIEICKKGRAAFLQ